jgi:hypothetical protein
MAPCLATANNVPCGRPMSWDVTAEQWRCESHGIRSIRDA